jgi:hypothetical protein
MKLDLAPILFGVRHVRVSDDQRRRVTGNAEARAGEVLPQVG